MVSLRKTHSHAGFLGVQYGMFKTSFCEGLFNDFRKVSNSLFIIAICLAVMSVTAVITAKRMSRPYGGGGIYGYEECREDSDEEATLAMEEDNAETIELAEYERHADDGSVEYFDVVERESAML